jgi:Zn-dependent metalloprotease
MRTNSPHHRCGVVPPHLLTHLANNPDYGAAARASLLADARHRAHRGLLVTTPTPAPAPAKGKLDRTVYDAGHKEDLPGKEIRKEGADPADDDDVNRAYDHLGATYKLYSEVYGRDSLDGKGLPLHGTVHYGRDYLNAFWDGQQMAFGDGDSKLFGTFTKDLTVIAHELTHGVTQNTLNLDYYDQAGALNEHISDVFGVLAVQYRDQTTADKASWLIGDELFMPAIEKDGKTVALRSMKAPGTAYDNEILGKDPQPATMDGFVQTFEDNGGVHLNSGIPNHAFYLAATEIGGKAWETAGKVWYAALTDTSKHKVSQKATFKEFAAATAGQAIRLFGDGSVEARAVVSAWEKVGVTAG